MQWALEVENFVRSLDIDEVDNLSIFYITSINFKNMMNSIYCIYRIYILNNNEGIISMTLIFYAIDT